MHEQINVLFFNTALVVGEGTAQKARIRRLCGLEPSGIPFRGALSPSGALHLKDIEASSGALRSHVYSLSLPTWPSSGDRCLTGVGPWPGSCREEWVPVSCPEPTMSVAVGWGCDGRRGDDM